jgi:hypothetical protein
MRAKGGSMIRLILALDEAILLCGALTWMVL